MKNIITLLSIVFLFSCNNSSKNDIKSILDEKVKYRGNISSDQYVNYNNNDFIGSIKLDTLPKNLTLSNFFIRNGKQYEVKIIDTEKVSFPYSTELNNVEVCCNYDTTIIFSEIINKKKYIIIPHLNKDKEWFKTFSYNNIFEVVSPKNENTKKRIDINLPMWGLKIGDYIDKNLIDSSIHNLREGFGSIRYQFLKSDKSIKLSTIEFENSNKLLITQIEKDDLTENEFNNFIDYIKLKHPNFVIDKNFIDESISKTRYTINYYGLMIVFVFTDFNLSDGDLKTYNFNITDDYTTTKRIIENEGKKFKYREGFKSID